MESETKTVYHVAWKEGDGEKESPILFGIGYTDYVKAVERAKEKVANAQHRNPDAPRIIWIGIRRTVTEFISIDEL